MGLIVQLLNDHWLLHLRQSGNVLLPLLVNLSHMVQPVRLLWFIDCLAPLVHLDNTGLWEIREEIVAVVKADL